MPCTSPTCTMCDHPTPAPPAVLGLESSLLSLTLSTLSAFPPFPSKSPHAKQLKSTLGTVLHWTAASAAKFVKAYEEGVLPLLDVRHAAVLAELERWEARMPALLAEEAKAASSSLRGKDEVGYGEVWERKKRTWREELGRIGEVNRMWEQLGPFLYEVVARAERAKVGEEERAASVPLHSAVGSMRSRGTLGGM
ncbi:hypothetical protein JCM8097_001479 [Rhodosporidiobolus ruineniae]